MEQYVVTFIFFGSVFAACLFLVCLYETAQRGNKSNQTRPPQAQEDLERGQGTYRSSNGNLVILVGTSTVTVATFSGGSGGFGCGSGDGCAGD